MASLGAPFDSVSTRTAMFGSTIQVMPVPGLNDAIRPVERAKGIASVRDEHSMPARLGRP